MDNKISKAEESLHDFCLQLQETDFEKGKKAEVGETRQHGGRSMVKQSDGSWKASSKQESKKEGGDEEKEDWGNISPDKAHEFKKDTLKDQITRVRKIYDNPKDEAQKTKAKEKLSQLKVRWGKLKKESPKAKKEEKMEKAWEVLGL